jgi:hypothetical protein
MGAIKYVDLDFAAESPFWWFRPASGVFVLITALLEHRSTKTALGLRLETASHVMTKSSSPSWGKQLPAERPRKTAET